MAIIPQPIFYRKLKRGDGGKRRIIQVTNTDENDFTGKIADVTKPEWIEIENFYPGQDVNFIGNNKKTALVIQINTDHKYFPKENSYDEPIKVEFEDGEELTLGVTIQEIQDAMQVYRGTFAIDFGTTNTVYSYKTSLEDALDKNDAFQRASCSDEIPTFIFFKDVSDRMNPKYSIGNEAKFDIKDNSSQTYSYFMSVKRQLGHEKKFIVMDEFGGVRPEHKQEWTAEDIAAYYIRAILERAQKDMQARIPAVVATFPTLFSDDNKQALISAFKKAFDMMEIEFNEDSLVLDLNETNAGTFSYIYGTMMDEFKRFEATERRSLLLAYDFGGGTIDVSLVDAKITREVAGITIGTDLKGLTGELYYGGDNVTLAVAKILKRRIALAAAEQRASQYEPEQTEEKKADEDDIWGGGGGDDDSGGDIWGSMDSVGFDEEEKKEEPQEEEGPSIMDDEEVEDIVNETDENVFKQAVLTIVEEKAIIDQSIGKAQSIFDAVMEAEKADGSFVSDDQTRKRAEIIEKAIETVYPTKYALYEDEDPFMEELSRKLFHELWHEADLLKIRMVNSEHKIGRIQAEMKKIAKYAAVEPVHLNEITVTLGELNAHVEDEVVATIKKAYNLYKKALEDLASGGGGLIVSSDVKAPELRILLFGNGSYLPLVKEKVLEIFEVDEGQLVMDKSILKRAVAIGACEEHNLRSAFGKGGFITYNFGDFLDKLPYSIGISHEDLVLLGFENGFCPIFKRGRKGGYSLVIDSKTYKLLHEGMTELPIYADYHDGAKPQYVGWFDWTAPSGEEPLESLWTQEVLESAGCSAPQPESEETAEEQDPFAEPPAEEPTEVGETPESVPVEIPRDDVFRVKMELLPSRKMRAYDLQTGKYYDFIPRKEKWDPNKFPFSGIH